MDNDQPLVTAVKSSSARAVKEILQMYPKQLHAQVSFIFSSKLYDRLEKVKDGWIIWLLFGHYFIVFYFVGRDDYTVSVRFLCHYHWFLLAGFWSLSFFGHSSWRLLFESISYTQRRISVFLSTISATDLAYCITFHEALSICYICYMLNEGQ